MPEGDTVHKVAQALGTRLAGVRIERARVRGAHDAGLAGRRVESVTARGKHLFIATDDERVIRSHLGLYGSWHRYAPDEPWKRPERQAGLVLWTARDVLVCFNPREVEVMAARGVRARIATSRLGPDLASPDTTLEGVVARARDIAAPSALMADVLLDQRVACGIGNVYKSEILFIERVHPRERLQEMPDAALGRLYRTARRLIRANLGGGPRITREARDGAGRLWVYRRSGAPCLRCDATVLGAKLGESWRSTYWCPACQREPSA